MAFEDKRKLIEESFAQTEVSKSLGRQRDFGLNMDEINIILSKELKEDSFKVLNELELSFDEAIRIFLKQVVLQDGLPFEVKIKRSSEDNEINE